MFKRFKFLISIVLMYLSIIFLFSGYWLHVHHKDVSLEQLLFHATIDIANANMDVVIVYLRKLLLILSIFTIFLVLLLVIYKLISKSNTRAFSSLSNALRPSSKYFVLLIKLVNTGIIMLFAFSSTVLAKEVELTSYIKQRINLSTLYEEYYVDPTEVNLTFPSVKRNLIHIVVESMETTFQDIEIDGQQVNLIPNLSRLMQENISISQDEGYNGIVPAPNTGWTVASLVAQTSGVPLNLVIDGNSYGKNGSFLPSITTLGDILEENNYQNIFLLGSDSSFGGRDSYYSTHGDYNILDYPYMLENEKLPSNYKVFWGYEDSKLFEFAKETIDSMDTSSPFNLEILTVDSHFPDGYTDASCDTNYSIAYANAVQCSDKLVGEFIDWFSKHPLYENTTIVITSDHYTMKSDFVNDEVLPRGLLNVIINSPKQKVSEFSRKATTLDMFPTIVSSLDIEIEGNRLGLGTDLLSETSTLVEELGKEYFFEQLRLRSKYYEENFLKEKR